MTGARPPGAVVVGTDGTVHSDDALRFAAAEAALRGSELVVVLGFVGAIDPDIDCEPGSTLAHRAEAAATAALSRALGLPPGSLPSHRIVCEELEPSWLLCWVTALVEAELIVIGHHHRHMLGQLLHGSPRSGDLARRSAVPVVIVPDHSQAVRVASKPACAAGGPATPHGPLPG